MGCQEQTDPRRPHESARGCSITARRLRVGQPAVPRSWDNTSTPGTFAPGNIYIYIYKHVTST